jgi:hypothetical protein
VWRGLDSPRKWFNSLVGKGGLAKLHLFFPAGSQSSHRSRGVRDDLQCSVDSRTLTKSLEEQKQVLASTLLAGTPPALFVFVKIVRDTFAASFGQAR